MVPKLVPFGIEVSDEGCDESASGQILRELVVDVLQQLLEIDSQSDGQPEHRADLGDAEGGSDSVSRGIRQKHHQIACRRSDQVERVAARLLRWAVQPSHVVAGYLRHLFGKCALLDVPGDAELTFQMSLGQTVLVILRVADGQRCEVRKLFQ
jgi:hypothetical protein